MDNTTKLVSELDFEARRSQIAAFIKNNSDFTDYNFEGSTLALLLDVLAYNSYTDAVYLNMAVNESFVETAQKRSSLVSLARNFGYLPRSMRSATATATFTVTETNPSKANGNTIYIDRNTKFTSSHAGNNFVFSPVETVTATSSNGNYVFTSVQLREGSIATISYVSSGGTGEKFLLNNYNVDLRSLTVSVQNSASDTRQTVYNQINDITSIDGTTPVYYLYETPTRNYEIGFGDGVFGASLVSGNIVSITFRTSNGTMGNGCSGFKLSGLVDGRLPDSNITYNTVVPASGGSDPEGSDSIRTNALQNFRTQGRAVTTDDYKFIISRDFPLAETVAVWGGQDNVPPVYGKVFISYKPVVGYTPTKADNDSLLALLERYNVATVTPVVVSPEYLWIEVNSTVKFKPRLTTLKSSDVAALVGTSIGTFGSTLSKSFDSTFAYSKFVEVIDSSDSSILGNLTSVKMRKNVPVTFGVSLNYTVDFQNPIHPGSLENKLPFQCSGDPSLGSLNSDLWMDDDEQGNVRIYRYTGPNLTQVTYLKNRAGTVDYASGKVVLSNFLPSSSSSSDGVSIDLRSKPYAYAIGDISTSMNHILAIDPNDVRVSVVAS